MMENKHAPRRGRARVTPLAVIVLAAALGLLVLTYGRFYRMAVGDDAALREGAFRDQLKQQQQHGGGGKKLSKGVHHAANPYHGVEDAAKQKMGRPDADAIRALKAQDRPPQDEQHREQARPHEEHGELPVLPDEHDHKQAAAAVAGRGLQCPPYDAAAIDAELQIPLRHLPRRKKTSVSQKYDRRAHNCAGDGIWNRVTIQDHHQILHDIVSLAGIRKGAFVLDWGSGCGHQLEFLYKEYDVTGVGIDVSSKTIAYARENTTKRNLHCTADGTKLEWIPDNTFDNAYSFGSIYHVYNRSKFCHVLRQMVRTVKPGGTVYNGWTENAEFKRDHVPMCLEDLPATFQIIEEKKAFENVKIFPLKALQTKPNSYSLVITKKRISADGEAAAAAGLGGGASSTATRVSDGFAYTFEGMPMTCGVHKCQLRPEAEIAAAHRQYRSNQAKKLKSEKSSKKENEENKDSEKEKAHDEAAPADNDKADNKAEEEPVATTAAAEDQAAAPTTAEGGENAESPTTVVAVEEDAAAVATTAAVEETAAAAVAETQEGEAATSEADADAKVTTTFSFAGWPSCPSYDPAIEALQIPLEHLPRKKKTSVSQKYDRRAHNCASNGVWHAITIDDHHAILRTIGQTIDAKKGDKVFDWGSGCGHQLEFMYNEFGARGLGIDVSNLTVAYAAANTSRANRFCVADGTKLEWIPDNTFDKAFSFGSIYHVYNKNSFCSVLRQMVRIVKPGGTVYNGWTEDSEFHRDQVARCVNDPTTFLTSSSSASERRSKRVLLAAAAVEEEAEGTTEAPPPAQDGGDGAEAASVTTFELNDDDLDVKGSKEKQAKNKKKKAALNSVKVAADSSSKKKKKYSKGIEKRKREVEEEKGDDGENAAADINKKSKKEAAVPRHGDGVEGTDHIVDIIPEKNLFAAVKRFPLKALRKSPNTYSIVIRKAGGGGGGGNSLRKDDQQQ